MWERACNHAIHWSSQTAALRIWQPHGASKQPAEGRAEALLEGGTPWRLGANVQEALHALNQRPSYRIVSPGKGRHRNDQTYTPITPSDQLAAFCFPPHNCGLCKIRGLVPHRKHTFPRGTAILTLDDKLSLLPIEHWAPGVKGPVGKKSGHLMLTGVSDADHSEEVGCCYTTCMEQYCIKAILLYDIKILYNLAPLVTVKG